MVENNYCRNIGTVRKAQKGSEIYGLLEKTAFLLSKKNPSKTETDNWFDAQERIAMWWQGAADDTWPMWHVLPEHIRYLAHDVSIMNDKFRQYHPEMENDSVKNLVMALDMFAKSIVDNYRVIPRLLLWPSLLQ